MAYRRRGRYRGFRRRRGRRRRGRRSRRRGGLYAKRIGRRM